MVVVFGGGGGGGRLYVYVVVVACGNVYTNNISLTYHHPVDTCYIQQREMHTPLVCDACMRVRVCMHRCGEDLHTADS